MGRLPVAYERASELRQQVPLICLVTSGEGIPPGFIREAASAGVDLIQLRERSLDGRALASLVGAAVAEASGTACRILVNDRIDIALAANASGVHLRADSFAAARVRSVTGPGFVIGRSVHNALEAASVTESGGCDYLIFGTVFPSPSKAPGHPVAGLDQLRDVCRATTLPVIAIGGISEENAADALAAGARGVAAISLFRGRQIAPIVARLRRAV
jgi:thiamine-phosphate pyrophosphorylase